MSAGSFAGEVAPSVGVAVGRAGAATESACAFAGEVTQPAGAAFGCTAAARDPAESFGAEVSPARSTGVAFPCAAEASGSGASFGAEVWPARSAGLAFGCAAVASGPDVSFGAEVSSAPLGAARLPVRRPRGGRTGSWRSTASRTARATIWPNVMCGSTCDSSPLSCSNPCRHSSSITALISHRPAPSGRIRSAGAVSSGSTPASQILYLPRALTGRLLHQRLPRRRVEHRRRRRFLRPLPGLRRCAGHARRRAGARHRSFGCRGRPGASLCAAPAAGLFALALLPIEGVLQQRRRVERQRAVPHPLARPFDLPAQPHRLDAAPSGGFAVAEFARGVIEQAGEAPGQVQAAALKLAQVVDDHDFELVFDGGQFLEPLHQMAVGKAGNGGGDRRFGSGAIHGANIMIENK